MYFDQQVEDVQNFKLTLWFLLYINGVRIGPFIMPTGHMMHQQFNIQQLYALPTPYLCVLYLSENKQQLVQLTA